MTDEAKIAQADLRRYKDEKRNIKDLANKIYALQSRINSTTTRLKEISIQSSSQQGKEELICILVDLRDEYTKQQCEAERLMLSMELKIDEISSGLYKRILRNHYLYNQRFEQISMTEHIGWRQIMRLHNKALNEYAIPFKRIDPDEYERIKQTLKDVI
jgi:hypothetical protein